MPQLAETSHALAGASQRGCARLRRCLGRPGRGQSWGGRPAGGQSEFGNFDFPVICGHIGPLYLTVGGGCSVRVGFGIGVALGDPGARSLLLVFRHQTSRGLSGFVVLVGVTWGAKGHVFIIVQVFCCFGKWEQAIAFRIRWSRRVPDINTHYPWIPAFAGMTDRNPANHLNWNAILRRGRAPLQVAALSGAWPANHLNGNATRASP